MRTLARRPLIAVLVVVVLLIVGRVTGQAPSASPSGSAAASASAPPRTPQVPLSEPDAAVVRTEADIASVEDPLLLEDAGRHHLKAGDAELARKCFTAAVEKREINLYTNHAGTPYGDALIEEMMGEHDAAEKMWRESFQSDVLYTFHALAHFSQHPKRKALMAEAEAHVRDLVERAKAGEEATIYITKKGQKRALEVISDEAALEQVATGEPLQYAYVDTLDLSKKRWDKRVGCVRCVVNKLLAYDADIEDKLDFKGFVLEDFHVGKKWNGEVNNSTFEPASRISRLYLEQSVFFGRADFDSLKLTGRVLNAPMTTFLGDTNFRNMEFGGNAEFRFAHFAKPVSFKTTHFGDSAYFAYAHFDDLDLSRILVSKRPMHFASATFTGDLLVEDARFMHGLSVENARIEGDATFRRCAIDGVFNMSRVVTTGNFVFQRNEAKDMLMYGGIVSGTAELDNNVFTGSVRFSLDELTRRDHLDDVDPLAKLYKLYQGDDDAEEDLTSQSQYGVKSVNDLVSKFYGNVSFANTYFRQFVGFERVTFGVEGKDQVSNFYNTQFGGEAHFERANFYGIADFRTIGGTELNFNQARFHKHWMLDDANVPGRLSTSETDLVGDALVSMAGADIRSFGIDYRQLLKNEQLLWRTGEHRLFYQKCALALDDGEDATPYLEDSRLADAAWDPDGEKRLTDQSAILERLESLCVGRTIDEFTMLRDSFNGRSMTDEADWAYWHVKHYINHRRVVEGGFWAGVWAFIERLIFEKAFGWGVLLANLGVTSIVVIFFYAIAMRVTCGDMEVEWDGEPTYYRELSPFALLIISLTAFLGGFGHGENLGMNSSSAYKALFHSEIVVGIIVITFFIGAYTRLVVG